MNKTQFRKRTKSLKKDLNRLIDDRIEKFLSSGCIDLNDYDDNYRLPKMFLSAMGEEIKFQYRPFVVHDKETVKNITRFL